MKVTERYQIVGSRAADIAASVEAAVREGRLGHGTQLPPVRELAGMLGVSAGTVAAAYQRLRDRGVVTTSGRRGTRVASRPPLPMAPAPLPSGVRDLASGNPDPALLPDLRPALARIDPGPHLYAEEAHSPALGELAARELTADGIPVPALAVVGGALDGIERALMAHLQAGDRVAVEDPGYPRVLDLLSAIGLIPHPVPIDHAGLLPDALEAAVAGGVAAVVLTPRAQNPTGAALDPDRAAALREVLRARPEVLIVEDDHAGTVAGAPALTVCDADRPAWAVLRSFSKALGPDLRLAVMTGAAPTVARVAGRQMLGTGWVSHLLQGVVTEVLTDPATEWLLARAAATYAARRDALVAALAAHGIPATGRSGLNVWIPVRDEARLTALLLDAGWAIGPGERYRLRTRPGLRVTVATLTPEEATAFAADLARCLTPGHATYAG